MEKKYRVTLTEEERTELGKLVSAGKTAARRLNHARILLMADASAEGLRRTDEQIAEALNIGRRTVERVRQRFVEEGFEAALDPKPRPRIPHKLKEKLKGDLVALAKTACPFWNRPRGSRRCGVFDAVVWPGTDGSAAARLLGRSARVFQGGHRRGDRLELLPEPTDPFGHPAEDLVEHVL